MTKIAARAGLVLALLLLTLVAPAALVEQNDEAHSVALATSPALLAIGAGVVLAAYAAYMLAWKVLR